MEMVKSGNDWFAWRATSKSQSVENRNADRYTVVLGWENRDVLYSFLGIYTIGLWVFYLDEFIRNYDLCGNVIPIWPGAI